MDVTVNTEQILKAVSTLAENSGRSSDAVSVIAVTKYVDTEVASQLIQAGIRHIGENRTDKFLEKYDALKQESVTWHLIGSLQRRKVKEVINYVDYFHALDSVKLAEEIQKRANHPINCFLQVNISGEVSKHGFTLEEVPQVLSEMAVFDKVRLVGIMTMAPADATLDELREIFHAAKALQQELSAQQRDHMPFTELSMGMSGDYPIAIQEGATFVRIGSAFFK